MTEDDFEVTDCVAECFFDREINACGSCYRTLEQIAAAGKEKKKNESILARSNTTAD